MALVSNGFKSQWVAEKRIIRDLRKGFEIIREMRKSPKMERERKVIENNKQKQKNWSLIIGKMAPQY